MKQIPLTKGKVVIVDDADYDWLVSMGKWCVSGNYAARSFCVSLNGKKRNVMRRMHRVIMNAPNEL